MPSDKAIWPNIAEGTLQFLGIKDDPQEKLVQRRRKLQALGEMLPQLEQEVNKYYQQDPDRFYKYRMNLEQIKELYRIKERENLAALEQFRPELPDVGVQAEQEKQLPGPVDVRPEQQAGIQEPQIQRNRIQFAGAAPSSTDVQPTDTIAPRVTPQEQGMVPQIESRPRSFAENIQESYDRGVQGADLDLMAFEASLGLRDYEEVKQLRDEYNEKVKRDPVEAENWLSGALHQVAEVAGPMVEGTKQGIATGAAAAGIGASTGFGVPAAPALFKGGAMVGSAQYWYRQGAGSMYMEMKEQGVDEDLAKVTSRIAAVPYAAIEFSQVIKAIPGARQAAKQAFMMTVKEAVQEGVKRFGRNYLAEVSEEGLQEIVQIAAVEGTKAIQNVLRNSGLPIATIQQMGERFLQTVVQAAQTFGFIIGPSAITSTAQDVREVRQEDKRFEQRGKDIQDVIQGTEFQRREARERPFRKQRESQVRLEKREQAEAEQEEIKSFTLDLLGKTVDTLSPLEREAMKYGVPIVKQDGSDYSDVYLRRRIKSERSKIRKQKYKGRKPEQKTAEQEDYLTKPIHLLTPEERGKIGKRVIELVDQGYSEEKINQLGLRGVQALLRGDIDEFQVRDFVEGQQEQQAEPEEQKAEVSGIPTFTIENSTEDALEVGKQAKGNEGMTARLAELRDQFRQSAQQMRESGDIQGAVNESFLAQLYREAYEVATGTGGAAEFVEKEELEDAETIRETEGQVPEGVSREGRQEAKTDTEQIKELVKEGKSLKQIKSSLEGTYEDTELQNMIEFAVAEIARNEIKGRSDKEAFDKLVEVYNNQPNLAKRTSETVLKQQYSTPLPLAWLMGKMVGADKAGSVYDPTAGTGMLFVSLPNMDDVYANELDKDRLGLLDRITQNTANEDATRKSPFGRKFDAVLMNPPFGKLKGKKSADGYEINKLEHWIAVQGLQDMQDNGTAALLIGGNAFKTNIGKEKGELSRNERIFFNWLYSNYNVTDHINIPGSLYSRQGTSSPTQLILINGRQKSDRIAPTGPDQITETKSWDDLYKILERRKDDGLLRTDERQRTGTPSGVGREGGQTTPDRTGVSRGADREDRGTGAPGPTEREEPTGRVRGGPGAGESERQGTGRETGEQQRGERPGVQGRTEEGETEPGRTGRTVQAGGAERPVRDSLSDTDYGSGNKVVSRDRAKEIRDKLRAKLTQKTQTGGPSGYAETFDPELLSLGTELAAFHVESGNRKFKDFARVMVQDMGEGIVPFLQSFYLGARNFPGIDKKRMNNESEIDRMVELGEIDDIVKDLTAEEKSVVETTEKEQAKQPENVFEAAQVPSYRQSKAPDLGTVMPRNIISQVEAALKKIEKETGQTVDDYVREKLQFKNLNELYNAFGAEQIDDLALAIYQMENGNGAIVGDQAGIGKGRVAAGLIHYGILQGRKPVFITKQANLFSDLWRDFINIGVTEHTPYIMNVHSNIRPADMQDLDGNVVHKAPRSREEREIILRRIVDQGPSAIDDYDFVVMTYSQTNQEANLQQRALARLAVDNYIIMDESHNATGRDSNTGEYYRPLVRDAKGVTFLSATYAKRPDNMALYNNTILGAYEIDSLIEAMEAGGVPLQEVVSSALAQAGQNIRHERSFDGVDFKLIPLTETAKEDARKADAVTEVLREMTVLDDIIGDIVKSIDAKLRKESKRATGQARIRDHARYVPFASKVHNVVGQLMLALKIDNAVNEAATAMEKGQKVIITLANTMESFLKQYVDAAGIAEGDIVDIDFREVMRKHLKNQLQYTFEEATGAKNKEDIPWQDSAIARAQIAKIEQMIDDLLVDVPASPIDLIRDRLQAKGYKVGELTGRSLQIDYSDEDNPTLQHRTDRDKIEIMRQFNGDTPQGRKNGKGDIDILIANRSASTGVSLHASESFGDKRPRMMMTIQPELDINEMVQMFGRIFRTGQVHLPEYRIVFSDLPGEKRPAAILSMKMASLNANVSAAQEGSIGLQIPNFINIYGDHVVREMVKDMSTKEQVEYFGHAYDTESIPNLTVRKATGDLSLAPVEQQEQFYNEFIENYELYINELNEKGENKLVAQELDYKAETLGKVLVFKGSDPNNPLTADGYIEEVEVNVLKKPVTRKALEETLKGRENEREAVLEKLVDAAEDYYGRRIEKINRLLSKAEKYEEQQKLRDQINELEDEKTHRLFMIREYLPEIGTAARLTEKEMDGGTTHSRVYTAVLTGISTKKAGSPIAFSNVVMTFTTNDPQRKRINVPLSKLPEVNPSLVDPDQQHVGNTWFTVEEGRREIPENWDETRKETAREITRIYTGNVFSAYLKLADRHDTIVRFTTKDGKIREGVIIRGDTSTDKLPTTDLSTVFRYVKKGRQPFIRPVEDGKFELAWDGENFLITVPRSQKDGIKYYGNKKLLAIVNDGIFREVRYRSDEKSSGSVPGFRAVVPVANEGRLKDILSEYGFSFLVSKAFVESDADPANKPGAGYIGRAMADTGGYRLAKKPGIIEMPEIVELVKELMDGKVPRVKEQLRIAKGMALGAFYPIPGMERIELKAEIFKDPELAKKVLSHEIGHLIDYLPDRLMTRGNILGRLASLKNYMQGWYDDQYRNSEIRDELKELSQIWKPFDPAADKKYTKYRHKSTELYADAISVLFNDPELLREVAPQFYDGFFNYLDRKPEVKRIYDVIQARINRSQAEILEERFQNQRAMIEAGEEKYRTMRTPIGDVIGTLRKQVYKGLVDKNSALITKRKEIIKQGRYIDPAEDPVYWLEELPYVSSQVFQYLRDIQNEMKRRMDIYGLNETDVGHYLFLNRAATERSEMANPQGIDKKAAQQGLEYLRVKLGPEKFSQLEEVIQIFRDIRNSKIKPVLLDGEMYNEKLIEKIENEENYATFQVQAYLDDNYGRKASGWIYKQIGTLADITNPFTATIMKDAAVVRSVLRKKAAQATVEFLKENFPTEIRAADKRWVNKRWEFLRPEDAKGVDPQKTGMIAFMHRGRMQAYYVDKLIADSFNADYAEAHVLLRAWSAMTRPFKAIFVSKNPAWSFWNIQRDIRGAALKLPKASLTSMIKYVVKSLPDAWRDVFLNNSTPVVRAMYEGRQLLVGRYFSMAEHGYETELERMLENYTLNPKKYKNVVHKAISRILDGLEIFGKFTERLVKIAGYKYIQDKLGQIPEKQAAHLVRTRAGSPDFYRRNQWYRFTNNLFLFSNAGKEGWRSSAEAFSENRSAFTWKLLKYSILPKMAMYGASIGAAAILAKEMAAGDDDDGDKYSLAEMYAYIPEHDKQNYFCIPIAMTDDQKCVYAIMPDDFFGQVFSGALWTALQIGRGRDVGELFDFITGEIPYTSLNPVVSASISALRFASGKNPYDEWRGELAISEQEFEAGGKYRNMRYLKWQAGELGLNTIWRPNYNDGEDAASDLEKLLGKPGIGPLMRRFIRVSDRGKYEALIRQAKEARQKKTYANLELREKIKEELKKTDEPSRLHARRLYNDLRDQGFEVGKFSQSFWRKYMMAALYKRDDAVIDALLQARSREEEIAILQKATGKMVDENYVKRFKNQLKRELNAKIP